LLGFAITGFDAPGARVGNHQETGATGINTSGMIAGVYRDAEK
jgi:hypothetical protein